MIDRILAMAQVPLIPANINPAPTKALKAINQGEKRTAMRTPSTTIEPATI
jgi:hypothetical protein